MRKTILTGLSLKWEQGSTTYYNHFLWNFASPKVKSCCGPIYHEQSIKLWKYHLFVHLFTANNELLFKWFLWVWMWTEFRKRCIIIINPEYYHHYNSPLITIFHLVMYMKFNTTFIIWSSQEYFCKCQQSCLLHFQNRCVKNIPASIELLWNLYSIL